MAILLVNVQKNHASSTVCHSHPNANILHRSLSSEITHLDGLVNASELGAHNVLVHQGYHRLVHLFNNKNNNKMICNVQGDNSDILDLTKHIQATANVQRTL